MTAKEMKRIMEEKGYTYDSLSEMTGIPAKTLQEIFSGKAPMPGYDVWVKVEQAFEDSLCVAESIAYSAIPRKKQGEYTIEDYRAWPQEERVELIDGDIIIMDAPRPLHQKIAGEIHRQIANFIMDNEGDCQPLIAPFDVQLDMDEKTMVQPDVGILCKKDKYKRWGIYGAPDFLLEVISPSSRYKDYIRKLHKYHKAGVREYWIIDPYKEKVLVYFFEEGDASGATIYGVNQPVPVNIYGGRLVIEFKHIDKWIQEEKLLE